MPASGLVVFVNPMKPELVNAIRPGEWVYEIKFDGYCAFALHGDTVTRILSRNGKDSGGKFPKVKEEVAAHAVHDASIDYAASGISMLCRISFYAAPRTEFPLARHSTVRIKSILLRGAACAYSSCSLHQLDLIWSQVLSNQGCSCP
jgi:hypothetical protein